MKKNKIILGTFSALATIAIPVAAVVSCGNKVKEKKLSPEQIKKENAKLVKKLTKDGNLAFDTNTEKGKEKMMDAFMKLAKGVDKNTGMVKFDKDYNIIHDGELVMTFKKGESKDSNAAMAELAKIPGMADLLQKAMQEMMKTPVNTTP